jgi:threonine aldolase
LSKGLSAPVGSVLCGTKSFIDRARRIRKQLGGGMRQAGVLAAAGIIALEKMVDRLQEDHDLAQLLARGLAEVEGVAPEHAVPPTNMVFALLAVDTPMTASQAAAGLKEHGVLVGSVGERRLRMVTHYGITAEDVARAVAAFRSVLAPVRQY